MSEMVAAACEEARGFVGPLGRRWLHVQAVARAARRLADRVGLDSEVLESAGWLHDIGYASELSKTGFHPLDGARHLHAQGWDPLIVRLVAHHSCARLEALERGLVEELEGEFERPPAEYEDALCFCDMTNGPSGEAVSVLDRLNEIEERYGPGDAVTRFIRSARPEILAAVGRVEAVLATSN